ncbi:MAG TPA: DinB family protein [Nocardioidaceae bacterium]|nr:DinB family protein [Nocardioidaceae bacterium]
MTIDPDTKDWTWVLDRPCDDCGFDSSAFEVEQLPELIRDNTRGWSLALAADDVAVRPLPQVWSPLEYACHVRDVHVLFDRRVAQMLEHDDPAFEDWDQDATAVRDAYGDQDPATVEVELIEAAAAVAGRYATVSVDQWSRRGTRSNGSVFTVESLGRYHLHDVVHHLFDVRS